MRPFVALKLARAAYVNAQDYLAQSRLLVEHRWYGRGLALAVLGQEEAAKAVCFYLYAIGAFQINKENLRKLRSHHATKQVLGLVPRMIMQAELIPDMIRIHESLTEGLEDRPYTVGSADREAMDQLTERLRVNLSELLREREQRLAELKEPATRRAKRLKRGALDRWKQRGLYADVKGRKNHLHQPCDITAADAKRELESLVEMLAPLQTLDFSFSDEGALDTMRELMAPLAQIARNEGSCNGE